MMMQKSALMLACLAAMLAVASANPLVDPSAVDDFANDFSDEELSEMKLIPDDDEEIGHLKENMEVFNEFCLEARNEVRNYLKSSVNGAAAKIFNIMMSTITDISTETLDVQKEEVQKGAQMIAETNLPPSQQGPESREKIAAELEQRVETIEKSGLLAKVTGALKSVFSAVMEAATSATAKRLALLKANFSGDNAQEKIDEACEDISYNLQRILNSKLAAAKKELVVSANPSLKEVIARAKITDIGCITTGRVAMVNRFCNFLKTVGPMIYPILGLGSGKSSDGMM